MQMAILYLTTNKIDGKKYIGVDGKNNPDYLGSGKYLKRAILKYGRENFTKEILFEFDSETDAYLKEIEIIHELNAVESKEYYNNRKDYLHEQIQCSCGLFLSRQHITRHKKTKKHIQFMESLNNSQNNVEVLS